MGARRAVLRDGPPWAAFARPLRYGAAIAGPVGAAGAQFLLSLVLLRALDPAAFGRFSFLLVGVQFGWGMWSALFCAPLPALLAGRDGPGARAVEETVLGANLAASLAGAALILILALAVGEPVRGSVLFAAFGAVSLLRWFARARAYALGGQARTVASDLVYAAALLALTALLWARGAGFDGAAAALLASSAIGLLPFGRGYLVAQFGRAPRPAGYRAVWREHARWSALGVVTTEATANAHAYIVTLLVGAAAFAPVAASALMIRPITVAMNAITDYERAQMGRQIGAGDVPAALRATGFFRLVLIAAWIATAIAILVLARFAPAIVLPPRYDRHTLAVGLALWMAVAMVRLLRMPDSALLQAGGAFRPLALASGWSSAASVAAVLVLVVAVGPLWSIVGILAGEALFALAIRRRRLAWTAEAMPCPA